MFNAGTGIIVSASNQYQTLLENYSTIVEKTNNQLGLWLTLSSYIVTVLGVMVAVIAIWVAFALWKNSSEQKEKFESFLIYQGKILKENADKFEQNAKKGREDAEAKLDALIAKQQKKMSYATEESKKEIRKAINDLEAAKATVGTGLNVNPSGYMPYAGLNVNPSGYMPYAGLNVNPSGYMPYAGLSVNPSGHYSYFSSDSGAYLLNDDTICATCGKTFNYMPSSSGIIHCTHCGAINNPN